MATVKEITSLCKDGQTDKAYELAKADVEISPNNPWAHRELGWTLNYKMKEDAETGNYQGLLAHIDELKTLSLLVLPQDNILFDNILFKIGGFIKEHVAPDHFETPAKLSALFTKLRDYSFDSSKGYSYLLQSFIKCGNWQEMADFIDWWNLDKLTQDDYTPYKLTNGKTILSLAERAILAKTKALLYLNERDRIEEFFPQLYELMETHPDMTYPGYCYGKLLLSLGRTSEEALKVIVPFARKKSTEFWVWQLLSDVLVNEPDKQKACLLRSVHCHTPEKFLGKVRIKLAELCIRQNQLELAKYQIDKVTQTYLSQGWNIPFEIRCWMDQPWIHTVTASDETSIDYMSMTNALLSIGTDEAVAIVTFVDPNTHKSILVYGTKKRTVLSNRYKFKSGTILNINYICESNDRIRVINTQKIDLKTDLDYAKTVEGIVIKRADKEFAFLKSDIVDIYISPNLVKQYQLRDQETIKSLIVFDYNRIKDTWGWVCIKIYKHK